MLSSGSLRLPNVPTLAENICSPTSLYSSPRSKLELWNHGTMALHQHWSYGTTFVCLDSVEEEEKFGTNKLGHTTSRHSIFMGNSLIERRTIVLLLLSLENHATSHKIFFSKVQDVLNPALFLSYLLGSKVSAFFQDRKNRHTFLSWQTSLLCMVVELAGGGSAINGSTLSSFLCIWWQVSSSCLR